MAAKRRRREAGVALAIAAGVVGGCVAERVSAVEGVPGGTDAASDTGGEVSVDAATETLGDGGVFSPCSPADAACVANNSGCQVGPYYLFDNQWNCGGDSGNTCGPESAYGCINADNNNVSWVVTSKQPAGNSVVLSYPAMQENFPSTEPLISSFTNITATFAETSPHVGIYEVAFDVWLNGVGESTSTQVMVWVDNYNRTPPGTPMVTAMLLAGHTYDVWKASKPSQITLVANPPFTSGTVNLLGIFDWAMGQGWLLSNATLGQIELGVEIVSTGGESATYAFNGFSIDAR